MAENELLSPAGLLLLQQAGGWLEAEWESFSADAITRTEVQAAVAEAIARITTDSPPPITGAVPPLLRRVVAMLRRRLIQADDSLPPGEFRTLIRRVEAISASLDPRWSDRFQNRMSGPNGLDLVVEVAHDLRSPLTSILFLAETMLRGRSGPLSTLQERQLGLVYSAAFGLNAVASDVIELVRGGDRLVGAERQDFSVDEVLESVRDIVLPIAEEKGLALTFEKPQAGFRSGYGGALNRVILNLTTNALKFTNEGEVTVRVLDAGPERLFCSVTDTGRGIPESAMATLFEPFRRRHQAGDYAFSGSGLGLSICRKLVEAMGSRLEVHTCPDQGTTFSFEVFAPISSGGISRG